MGQIRGFFSDQTQCRFTLENVLNLIWKNPPYLSHFEPIWPTFGPNLVTHLSSLACLWLAATGTVARLGPYHQTVTKCEDIVLKNKIIIRKLIDLYIFACRTKIYNQDDFYKYQMTPVGQNLTGMLPLWYGCIYTKVAAARWMLVNSPQHFSLLSCWIICADWRLTPGSCDCQVNFFSNYHY